MVAMGNKRDVDIPFIGDSEIDDAIVVQIDTGERTKRLRVMLNEAVLYDGDPEEYGVVPLSQTELVHAYRRLTEIALDAKCIAADAGNLAGRMKKIARAAGVSLSEEEKAGG